MQKFKLRFMSDSLLRATHALGKKYNAMVHHYHKELLSIKKSAVSVLYK